MRKEKLSKDDVSRLLNETSVAVKKDTAAKIVAELESGALSDTEKALVEDIFKIMAHDAEIAVRMVLAQSCSALPRDISLRLADDVDQIALPVLERSQSLTDEDLIKFAGSKNQERQIAISKRINLGSLVSDALIESHNPEVVKSLIANQTAHISEPGLQRVVDEFGETQDIQNALAERKTLPSVVVERLVVMVSERLRQDLTKRHDLDPEKVAQLVQASREKATITLTAGIDRDDVEQLIVQMDMNKRLTPSIILRSICMGDLPFFEAAMARCGRIPLENAQILIHDPGRSGFTALYNQAGLPNSLYKAFDCALDISRETAFDGAFMDRERYCQRMIERILTQYEDDELVIDWPDIDFLLGKMEQLQAVVASGKPS